MWLSQSPPVVTPPGSPPTVTGTSPANAATNAFVNAKVIATFSKAMNPATITTATFFVKHGSVDVAGTVAYAGFSATFTPNNNLLFLTGHTATITTAVKDTTGRALASNVVWSFTTVPAPVVDTTRPTVTTTSPISAVAVNSNIQVSFSEAMDASTITASTFTLKQGTTPVAGAVTYTALTATFDPTAALVAATTYTATVTVGAKDLAGNAFLADYVWTLTTAPGTVVDTTRPLVSSTSPVTAVAVNADITATFSEAMDPNTMSAATFSVRQGATVVPGVVTYVGNTVTFNPDADLAADTTYSATITTGAKDVAGNALLADFAWTFATATGTVVDTTPPTVTDTSSKVGVALDSDITATFSEAMDAATITASTFTIMQDTTPVTGVVTLAGLVVTFNPAADFLNATTYTATITAGATDVAGNALTAPFVWTFVTASGTGPCTQNAVNLGSAAAFAVLAGSTVTNTGLTNVTGDLGVSPGSAVTGFGPGVLIGTQHAGDQVAADAIADLTIAYNDAAGRTLCPVDIAGNIGGMTLTPGLYKSTSSLEISSGSLYLDAGGDPLAVFIFQIATTLDVAAGLGVVLVNGTSADQIVWQVGTSATLGVGSTFAGSILADQAISIGTGAVLDGRALARIAAVNLDSCTVTKPEA